MMRPNSPIFPPQQLTINTPMSQLDQDLDSPGARPASPALLPPLPDKPTCSTSSIQVYIIPTEQNLFVEGFDSQEYGSRPPTLLRGCLYVRVLKPTKIKSITLSFKGVQRTEWPEGIPPKKQLYAEINDVISHTWPFFTGTNNTINNGADYFVELNNHRRYLSASFNDLKRLNTNSSDSSLSSSSVADTTTSSTVVNFLSRNLSPSFIRRGKSPSVSSMDMPDLSLVISPGSVNDVNGPTTFVPGDYIYNFEHPLPPSIPETTNVTFGSTNYNMEVSIVRAGAFKSNLSGKLPINIVRTPAESNMEENESIVITRDWEDQLRYDIVIGSKSIVLDSYLPLAFRFVPLWGKVSLHRIRVYLSENLEYFCSNKRVHRMEPPKKFLLLEHKAKKGRSLLSSRPVNDDDDAEDEEEDNFDEDILPKELEFQLYVPHDLNNRYSAKIHPDTSYENIQAHHWIKICLRISKPDPNNPEKRKHYEISIDSPMHVLSPLAAHTNTLLPAYDDFIPQLSSEPLSPGVIPVDGTATPEIEFHHISTTTDLDGVARDADMHLSANLYHPTPDEATIRAMNSPQAVPHPNIYSSPLVRPIHILRKPSVNPPPFDADISPPGIDHHVMNAFPPAYDMHVLDDDISPIREGNLAPIREQLARSVAGQVDPVATNGAAMSPIREQLTRSIGQTHRSESYQSQNSSSSGSSQGSSIVINVPHNPRPQVATTGNDEFAQDSSANGTPQVIETPSTLQTEAVEEPARSTPQIILNNSEDITDHPRSPILPPLSPATSQVHDIEEATRSPLLDPEEHDITDNPQSPIIPPHRLSSPTTSRNSSFDIPLDQTMPLLDLSNSNEQPPPETRGSVTSSIFDLSYRHPQPTKLIGFIDEESSHEFHEMNHSLHQLRNPRISRHYQEEQEEEERIVQQDSTRERSVDSDKDVTNEIPGFKIGFVIGDQ